MREWYCWLLYLCAYRGTQFWAAYPAGCCVHSRLKTETLTKSQDSDHLSYRRMGEEFIFQAGTPALLVKLYSCHYQACYCFLFKHAAVGVGRSRGWVSVHPSLSEHQALHLHILTGWGTPAPARGTRAWQQRTRSMTHSPCPWEGCWAKTKHTSEAFREATQASRLCFCPMG